MTVANTEQTSDARRRGFTVAVFSLLPLLIPTIIYASLLAFSDIESRRSVGPETEHAEIRYPINGKLVPQNYTAQGSLRDIPEGYHAYLSTGSSDMYWPKIALKKGDWTLALTAKGASGFKYNLSIIAVNKAGKDRIDQWFITSKATGKYPPLKHFEGLQTLAAVRVEL